MHHTPSCSGYELGSTQTGIGFTVAMKAPVLKGPDVGRKGDVEMVSNETTYSGKLGELTRLSAAMNANAADLPHLEGPRIRMDKILGDVKEIAQQQAAMTASKQESSKRLKALIVEGQRLATGMVRFLQEHYGNRSEKLAEFGLQPFRGRKPRTPKAKTPPPTEPPATPTPAQSAADPTPKQ